MTEKPWLMLLALVLAAMAIPGAAGANLVCPGCDPETAGPLGVAEVVDLVFSSLLSRGISILLLGATTVVGIPWVIAGIAVALIYLPRKLKTPS